MCPAGLQISLFLEKASLKLPVWSPRSSSSSSLPSVILLAPPTAAERRKPLINPGECILLFPVRTSHLPGHFSIQPWPAEDRALRGSRKRSAAPHLRSGLGKLQGPPLKGPWGVGG